MGFINFIYLVVFSLAVIWVGKYMYTLMGVGGSSNVDNDHTLFSAAAAAAHELGSGIDGVPMPAPLNPIIENPDGTTDIMAGEPTTNDYRSRIPLSEPSRIEGECMGGFQEGQQPSQPVQPPAYDPVQLLNPIPNDRLMPVSVARDDPIKTRLDTAESMGLYQNILEKEMKQTSGVGANKNRFFEMGVRDSAYHLYGKADGGNSFDKQQQFTQQPPRVNFEINYKELDQKMYADKQKYNGNFMAIAANGGSAGF